LIFIYYSILYKVLQHTLTSIIISVKKGGLGMSKTSPEVKNRWNEKNYDRITVMAKKGKKEEWLKIAKEKGYKGLSGYIIHCVEKENQGGVNSDDI
jgi:preprotein translocase subunit Sss1